MLRIIRRGAVVRLVSPEGTFSYYDPQRLFTGFAWDSQTASLTWAARPIRSILLLGLGGGTVARQCRRLLPVAEIVGIERDPWVVDAARRWFDLGSLGVEVRAEPAERFLQDDERRFDAVLDDVWSPEPGQPKPLLADERWAGLVRDRLHPGGIYAMSVYGQREQPAQFAEAVRRLGAVFRAVGEARPALGQVTVLAAGSLVSTRHARSRLRRLPAPCAAGLACVRLRRLRP